MQWYKKTTDETMNAFQTSQTHGLTAVEASEKRQAEGDNVIHEGEVSSRLQTFLLQFKDFMVLVLIAATLVSGLLGEYIDALAILAIILLNGCLGYIQERKAEKSLASLKALSAPQTLVLRDGAWEKVPSLELVTGDIIRLQSGDRVGADCRLLTADRLQVDESALTGESLPVDKTTAALLADELSLGDQENMSFMGTLITRGSGTAVVTATGMQTAMGTIADLIQSSASITTPLQRKLEELGKILIVAALGLTFIVVLLGIWQGHELYTMVLAGVSLAVAAIPEGLPAIVTVALALGVQRMIRRNAIIRKLPAVETLGCTSVICSDKTGTLTKNEMTVQRLWAGGEEWQVSGSGYAPKGSFHIPGSPDTEVDARHAPQLQQLLTFGALCNHADIQLDESGQYKLQGDPTDGALLAVASKAGIDRKGLLDDFTVVQEFPFDSQRKMMSVIVQNKKNELFVITKGAPDFISQRCNRRIHNGRIQRMGTTETRQMADVVDQMADDALRTLAVAYKKLVSIDEAKDIERVESELVLVGVAGMIDPPREGVRESIDACRDAGIRTVMITGDHAKTAAAIAGQLGMRRANGRILEGRQLDQMSAEELATDIDHIDVFARVSPTHKLRIVQAYQKRGHVCAMTGDGVNDAPAIKAADIGISMGKTGTDVAREASDLILTDDRFETIQAAVKEGRNIYENVRKFIRYLLASNVGEILVMLFAMLAGLPLPLVPIQILWVNLVTDGLPALALGMDQPEDEVMRRKPRPLKEGIFSRGLAWKIISRGFLIGAASLLAFWLTLNESGELIEAQTVAFLTLVMAQLIHVFDCRSDHSIFHRNPFQNMFLVAAVLLSFLMVLVVVYVPGLQTIFHTVPIGWREWLLVLGMAAIPTFLLSIFHFQSGAKQLQRRKPGVALK
ncbi:cation-translocating P-type ATPase [Aureibacillus halotolerans]|uniref:P-type Ca(2+) transporter n=1 Tax=Aureibacillus halotolerans TaxID=1508390 RepID=A0A4R6U9A8_9BACI|nr:cation-translocating P-type ATPase [Aureibacillus halotolerans]TDQ42362.1 Ca2+-transporting ATPase [Aureibacillus halotolerans]